MYLVEKNEVLFELQWKRSIVQEFEAATCALLRNGPTDAQMTRNIKCCNFLNFSNFFKRLWIYILEMLLFQNK